MTTDRDKLRPIARPELAEPASLFCWLLAFLLAVGLSGKLSTAHAQQPSFITNGLVAYYPFNGNGNDESGNNQNLTNSGATLCPDRFGNPNRAFYFNGVSSYMSSGDTDLSLPVGAADRTLSVWIKANSAVTNGGTYVPVDFGSGAGAENQLFGLLLQNDDWLVHFGGAGEDVSSGVPLDASWHQVVCIYSSGNAQMFIDGIQRLASAKSTDTARGALFVGCSIAGPSSEYSEFFPGVLDDVRIYNRALSADEVAQLYAYESTNSGSPAAPTLTAQSWSVDDSGTEVSLFGVAYGANRFVAVGDSGAVLTSPDGVHWTGQASGNANNLASVAFGLSVFVAVGDEGIILTSPNGVQWTSRDTGANYDFRGIAFGNGLFVAVGDGGMIKTSPNGINWSDHSGNPINLRGVAYGKAGFVVVGDAGEIRTSLDATNWTTQNSGIGSTLNAIAYGTNTFATVGDAYTNVWTSPDGVAWSLQNSGRGNNFRGITYANGAFVAVGDQGAILASADGVNWTSPYSGTGQQLNSVAFGNNSFVAVGFSGTILLSQPVVWNTALAMPLGTENTSQPGFRAKVFQVTPRTSASQNNCNEWAEEILAGLWGVNAANLADTNYPFSDGYFYVTNYLNLSVAGQCCFTIAPGYPEMPFPAIPGLVPDYYGLRYENFACEFQTWIPFAAAGEYTFCVTSDDGFRAYEATNHGRLCGLNVTAPTNIAKMYAAFPSQPENGGFAAPLPRNGLISGRLVAANPILGNDPSGHLLNADEVLNNLVLIQYGGGPSYQKLVSEAELAGASACVIFDSLTNSGNPPAEMIGTSGSVSIPAVMMSYIDGLMLSRSANAPGGVMADLGDDGTSVRLGEFDGTRGQADTVFSFYVPQPGVFPLRIIYEQGVGAANIEFWQIFSDGSRALVNDVAHGALAAYAGLLPLNLLEPGIFAQPQNPNVLAGQSATLFVSASGSQPLTYQWYVGASGNTASPIAGATNAVFTTPPLFSTGGFWVAVQNAFGATNSTTAIVTVFPDNTPSLGVNVVAGLPFLTIAGEVGTSYRLQYSTDLGSTNWSQLVKLSLPSSPFTFTDSGATNVERFYRAVTP
jgi:hypothetical protein